MKSRFNKLRVAALAGVATIACSPVAALAQDGDEENNDDIVVTGTLIRGVEATGSQSIDLGTERIQQIGASTTNDLLAELPQVSNLFNERFDQDPRAADRLQITRPNLRNLPGVNATSGSTTLILVDGHRMVPMGVDQAVFDANSISPGAIERVEVVTDGGSSLYGADAVGGVINFITRDSFDGFEIGGTVELGDEYEAFSVNATAGTTWSNGSAFVSYSYYDRGILLNGDRDWALNGDFTTTTSDIPNFAGSECRQPVGVETRFFYVPTFGIFTSNPAAPGAGVFPVGTACDDVSEETLVPALERHTVLGGLQVDFSDSVSFEIKGLFGDTQTRFEKYPIGDTVSEPAPSGANPADVAEAFANNLLVSRFAVGFSYEPNAAYVDRDQFYDLRVYSITPELTFQFADDWQLRTTMNWGRSENSRVLPTSNRARLEAAVAAGQLDPNNIAAADASVITGILNSELAGEANQELFLLRAVVDGPLFNLGENEVRVALGAEYNHDSAELRSDQVDIGGLSAIPFNENDRDVVSAFAEVSIPVGDIIDISLSGRYDDYSDFGDTFNPNVGISIEPIDGIRFFGHWGESFNAPTALDGARTANARFIPGAAAGVPDPNGERFPSTRDDVLLLEGSGGALQPQEAESWSIGGEFTPVSNLRISFNYYNIDFTNLLSAVNPQLASVVLLNPDKFVFNPTQAEFDQFLALTTNGVAQFGNINANDVGVIVDRRVANLDAATLEGLDFAIDHFTDLGFGELNIGLSGNHQLDFNLTSSGRTVDQLAFDTSDLQLQTYIGLNSGGFSSRLTMNYSAGFDTNTAVGQTEVDGYAVFNLFLGYDFPENSGVLDGVSVRLNVDNVFDEDPPFWRRNRNPAYAFFTLGRVFKLGLTKRF